ncbi:hypothetical protein [Tissierella praeacuta]|uniref:hypothetical protein n=1 Tax=Tissierella praeacuta TaxID=43131 RepID=UPI00333E5058
MNEREYQRWKEISSKGILRYVVYRAIIFTIVYIIIFFILFKEINLLKEFLQWFFVNILICLTNWSVNQKRYSSYNKFEDGK